MWILPFLTGAIITFLSILAGLYVGSRLSRGEPIPPFEALDKLTETSPQDLDRSDEKEYEIEQARKGEPEV